MKLQILGILCKGFGIFVLVVVQQAQRVTVIASIFPFGKYSQM